jgi:hypothetical protein
MYAFSIYPACNVSHSTHSPILGDLLITETPKEHKKVNNTGAVMMF